MANGTCQAPRQHSLMLMDHTVHLHAKWSAIPFLRGCIFTYEFEGEWDSNFGIGVC
jgi:hypothetical protein